jgi:hypothetical protein
MNVTVLLVFCLVILAITIAALIYCIHWVRGMARADAEISRELRLIVHDLIRFDPSIEEPLQLTLHKLDDWEKRMDRVERATFMKSPWGR